MEVVFYYVNFISIIASFLMTYEIVLVDPKESRWLKIFYGTLCFLFIYTLSFFVIHLLSLIFAFLFLLVGMPFPESFSYLIVGFGFIYGGYESIKKRGYEEKLKEDLKSLYHKII